MFDLEQSIADWRRQMLAAGIKAPVPLEELEIHLREEIEQQVNSGTTAQAAFKIAVEQMGKTESLKTEFVKKSAWNIGTDCWPGLPGERVRWPSRFFYPLLSTDGVGNVPACPPQP